MRPIRPIQKRKKKTMTKQRIKIAASTIQTREEMEALVGEITALKTNEQRLTAEMNEAVNAVRQNYEAQLGAIDEDITAKTALARAWAEEHPAEFGKGKSISMTHGDVGWRIGNPTLKTLRGWTWDRVLESLRAGHWTKYLRVKSEVNKELLLADRATVNLADVGCRVVQDETFFIEPRIQTPEARVTQEAQ